MSRWKLSSLPAPKSVSTGSVSNPKSTGRWSLGAPGANTRDIAAVAGSIVLGTTTSAVKVVADVGGAASNNIRVRIVVAGASTALSIAVSGNDITVNSATNGSSTATTTAAQAATAINADGPASALVTASPNDGTGAGVVAAVAYTNLAAGADRKYGT